MADTADRSGGLTGAPTTALSVRDLTVRFGGLTAVDRVSFEVPQGSVHGLIGPNGAGKTTVFNLISGLIAPTAGEIFLEDRRLNGLASYDRTQLGLARTFQNIRTFQSMSLVENVMIGCHSRMRYSIGDLLLWRRRFRSIESEAIERAHSLLRFVGLEDHERCAGDLSYGDQRRVELARALASEPKVLLLDEPAAGLNPSETEELLELIRRLRDIELTVLVVEHDMKFIMRLCDRITVLNFGRRIAEGIPNEIKANPVVIEAYLGNETDERAKAALG